jgi:membrane protein
MTVEKLAWIFGRRVLARPLREVVQFCLERRARCAMWSFLTQTFKEFNDDDCLEMAASLSYYMFFALPALLVTVVFIGGSLIGQADVQRQLESHLQDTVGSQGAKEMTMILKNASQPQESWIGWTVGAVMLVVARFSSSGFSRSCSSWPSRFCCLSPLF